MSTSQLNFECPICLEPLSHPTTTSCGHTYCAKCILAVWQKRGEDRPCECPVDRRPISMLVPNYLLRGTDAVPAAGASTSPVTGASKQELDAQLSRYNHRFSDSPRAVGDRIRDAHTLGRSLLINSIAFKALVAVSTLVAVVYFLLPRDLIPDDWGIVGYFDDIAVAIFCCSSISLPQPVVSLTTNNTVWLVFAYVEAYRGKLISRLDAEGQL